MKDSIDKILKICSNCPNRFFNLCGKGTLVRLFRDEKGHLCQFFSPGNLPTNDFMFGEEEYENINECWFKGSIYRKLCNCSNFIFTNNKSMTIHRNNFFYKELSKTISKGHIKMQIESSCPYFMEFWFMKINAKQIFKNIILKDA